jgi:hypothetical protein
MADTALDTVWTAAIATIGDSNTSGAIRKAEATSVKDRYLASLEKQAALENNEIQSYTIGGRTFTRRDAGAGQNVINSLRSELHSLVYGTIVLADNNSESSGSA